MAQDLRVYARGGQQRAADLARVQPPRAQSLPSSCSRYASIDCSVSMCPSLDFVQAVILSSNVALTNAKKGAFSALMAV